MKNIISYSHYINENIKIIYTKDDEDSFVITLKDNKNLIGSCYIDIKSNAYYYFEGDITEEEYDKLFPDDCFVHIENISINDDYKGKGYAKKLIELSIEKSKKLGYKRVYLNCCPINMRKDLPRLIKLYESFGFVVFLHQKNNALMVKNLE